MERRCALELEQLKQNDSNAFTVSFIAFKRDVGAKLPYAAKRADLPLHIRSRSQGEPFWTSSSCLYDLSSKKDQGKTPTIGA